MEFATDKNWKRTIKKVLLNKLFVVKITGYSELIGQAYVDDFM